MIWISSDHGGYYKKQALSRWLIKLGFKINDIGPDNKVSNDDYPAWASRTSRIIQKDKSHLGILLCRSGVGMAIVANKFSGIRAAQVCNRKMAVQSKLDENTNIISLAADYLSQDQINKIALAWLQTKYKPIKRFQRRLKAISRIEHAG